MEQTTPSSPHVESIKSLIYWRKSPINGFRCVPVLLTLEESGTLALKTAKNEFVFEVPLSQVGAHFTGWGTMVLVVDNKKYVFVGIAAALSPSPTAAQKAELAGEYSSLESIGGRTGAAGLGVGAVASSAGQQGVGVAVGVAGVAMQQAAYYRSLKTMREWQDIFMQAGVLTGKKNTMKFMKYYLVGLIILTIFFVLLGVLGKNA